MSKWSGKYDFCDHLEMVGAKENFEKFKEKTKLYIYMPEGRGYCKKEIKFSVYEDLIPYFTHIICVSISNNGINEITLSSKSWLETDNYCPTVYRLDMMKEFGSFVKQNGKEPLWEISPKEMESWNKCPIGEPYFCEFNVYKNGDDSKKEHICPYMYAKKKKDGEICKLRYRRNKRI